MKILITTPTYPPFNSGLGNIVQIQAKLISSLGHDVTVVTSGQSGVVRIDVVANARIVEFSITGADYIPRPITGERDKYTEFLLNSDFDVVLLNAWQNWATDVALNCLNGIKGKVFVYSHCISTNSFIGANFLRSLVGYLFWRPYWFGLLKKIEKLDGVIFLSNNGCDARFDDLRLVAREKIKYWIIPNAIPNYAEEVVCLENSSKENRTQITSVASYDWFKGHDFVIRSYSNSVAKNNIKLKLFGQKFTNHTKYLIKLARDLGISDKFIEFNEGLSGAQLMEQYLRSLIFINGSHSECQPLVLLDAMTAGVPFISKRSGSIPYLNGGYCVATHLEASLIIDVLIKDNKVWLQKSIEGKLFILDNHMQNKIKHLFSNFLGN